MPTLRRIGLHVGRRGAFLILFGAVYLLIGYSYLTLTPASETAVRHALRLALNAAPLPAWGWAWITAGVTAAACGAVCPGRKAVGYGVAVAPPALWAVVYLAAWLAGDVPRGWVSAAIYAALAAAVAVIAGMPEPRDLIGVRR